MELPQILPIIIQDADDKKGDRDLLNSIEKHVVDGLSSFIFANQTKFKAGKTILAQHKQMVIKLNIVLNKKWVI
ncbi:hypothetical protein [Spiroplasma endosymbiont of Seladonia tumulorum]|uniref:hypothetical protein n=1 Tax=Spiroplasma endosymbiont of Seladonia tumulorum TaxID=3066321 RepID=UPI0030D1F53D